MKASIALSILILAAAALFGWKQQGQLTAAREARSQVMAEARALGLAPDALLADGSAPLPSKLGRLDAADKAAAASAFAKELIAFAVEMKAAEKESGGVPDEAMQTRGMEVIGRLLDFDASQIEQIIADLKASTEIDDKTRGEIIAFSVMMLANDHPEAALAMFTETSELKEMQGMGDHIVSAALGKWAEKDPMAALEWIRENSEKHSKLVTDQAKAAVIAGAAKQDPKLAIRLIDELELEHKVNAATSLATSARTPEERDNLIAALREGGDKHRDMLHSVLGSMANQMAGQSFEEGQRWLGGAKLSEKEMEQFARSIAPWQTKDDTGKWIEWMADKLPPKQLAEKQDQMVTQWTRQDFKAAGDWINGSPEGPAKVAAVKSFAKTVAPFEPETAVQWANTLPAGQEREELLRQIQEAKKPGVAVGGLVREPTPEPEDE
jgi:hypothetical protein